MLYRCLNAIQMYVCYTDVCMLYGCLNAIQMYECYTDVCMLYGYESFYLLLLYVFFVIFPQLRSIMSTVGSAHFVGISTEKSYSGCM